MSIQTAQKFSANGLADISEKIRAGERLSFEDGVRLFESNDLLTLGSLANDVRERLHGDVTTFNVNRHLNPTNVCIYSCAFCAFARRENEDGAYIYSMDEIRAKVRALGERVREIHIVGGMHAKLPYDYYLDVLRAIKKERPDIHLKAYTAVEIDFLSGLSRKPLEAVLDDVLTRDVLEDAVNEAISTVQGEDDTGPESARVDKEIARLEGERTRLANAIAAGGDLDGP